MGHFCAAAALRDPDASRKLPRGTSEHSVATAPSSRYDPGGQGAQAAAPGSGAYKPGPHGRQAAVVPTTPLAFWKVPAGQGTHTLLPSAATAPTVPAGQGRQAVAPSAAVVEPTGQARQVDSTEAPFSPE
jgi:hypothetical protein